MSDTICTIAIKKAGGPAKLAAALSDGGEPITSQAISQWKKVPGRRVRKVAELTGFHPAQLRPDLFEGMEVAE